jgi:glycine oxidase
MIIVVGGGAIGLSIAYELLQRGCKVTVLDADNKGTAYRAAGGMLAPTSESESLHPDVLKLGLDSLQRYGKFVSGLENLTNLSCDYRQAGTLWVALNQDYLAELNHLRAIAREKNLPIVDVTKEEALAREPALSSRVIGGVYIPQDHCLDPRALVNALKVAVVKLGGKIEYRRVDEVLYNADTAYGVRCGDDQILADKVLVTTGAWTSELLPQFKVRPVKGQNFRLRGPEIITHVLHTKDVYIVPRAHGYIHVGGTTEEQGFDTTSRAFMLREILQLAWKLVPAIDEFEFIEACVGFRPALADHSPILGKTSKSNVYVATGHYRDGILLAAATAHYMAELMTTGIVPEELKLFDPRRRA